LNLNPVVLLTGPYSKLGAGIIVLPAKDPKAAILSVSAISSDGVANSTGFNTLFKGNTTFAAEGRVKTDFFELTGHQLVGSMYSTKNYTSLQQNLRFIVQNGAIEQKEGSWCFYYDFDQYLYETKKGSDKGIGVFGRFGASDGNPNPIHYFYSVGIRGKGVIPAHSMDQFGIGYYYIVIGNPALTGPLTTRDIFRDEQGVEGYYNFAVTQWMKLTPDIQVIRPGQKQELNVTTAPPTIIRNSMSTAFVMGLRLQLIF